MININKIAIKIGQAQAIGIFDLGDGHKEQNLNEANRLASVKIQQYELKLLKRGLISEFPEEEETLNNHINSVIVESREDFEKKIERDYRPTNALFDSTAFMNISDVEIPEDIQLVLSFGPKFIFPSQINLPNIIDLLAESCMAIEWYFPIVTQQEAYKHLAIQFNKYLNKYNTDIEKWLLFVKYRLEVFMKNNPDIIIARSDKGKHTVVLNKSDYINKMNKLVESTTDYILTDDINITELENTSNAFNSELVKQGAINNIHTYREYCTTIAKMYGLVKIHKKEYPVRPITAGCGSPGFKLSKFITELLGKVFPEDGLHVINSVIVKNKLEGLKINDDETMISLDVVSMFTNIPIDLMLEIIHERKHTLEHKFSISWELFTNIFKFTLKDCAIFSFNDKVYRQKDSLAMGSPTSPILAKILMTHIVDWVLDSLPRKPKFTALYVDDSFWIIHKNDIDTLLNKFNSFHPRIKFTIEHEKECSINFLELTISHDPDGTLFTCWYKKPFASCRLLNYFSQHSHTCIIETAKSYMKSILKLSDPRFFHKNKTTLTDMLRLNNFPEDIITKLFQTNYTLMIQTKNKVRTHTNYIPIINIPRFSDVLIDRYSCLNTLCKFTLVPYKKNKTKFSYIKDKCPIGELSNVLVEIECNCKKYIDIRYTKFGQTADKIINEVNNLYDTSDGTCTRNKHKLNRWKITRCKNAAVLKQKFEILQHINRGRLNFPKYSLMHYRLKKIINKIST